MKQKKNRTHRENNFQCSHAGHDGHCRRTLEECRGPKCPVFGLCGECQDYYIPAGQEPCKGCQNLFGMKGGEEHEPV